MNKIKKENRFSLPTGMLNDKYKNAITFRKLLSNISDSVSSVWDTLGSAISGKDYVVVTPGESEEKSGENLMAAVAKANAADTGYNRRFSIIIYPGVYDCSPLINNEFIDVKSITGEADVIVSGFSVVKDNCRVSGINCGDGIFILDTGLNGIVLNKCIALGEGSFCKNGIFKATAYDCIGHDYAFGGGPDGGEFQGHAYRCTGNEYSFGGAGTFSGYAEYCTGWFHSFAGAGGYFSGTAYWCTGDTGSFGGEGGTMDGDCYFCFGCDEAFGGGGGTFNGHAYDCWTNGSSFGGNHPDRPSDNGIFNGIAVRCRGESNCFGGGPNGRVGDNAVLKWCSGIDNCFGGENGEFKGYAFNCESGVNSFVNDSKGDTHFIEGVIEMCKTEGSFGSPIGSGRISMSIDGAGNIINLP